MHDRSTITLRTYRVTGAGERQDVTETREYGGTLPSDGMFRNPNRWAPCKCAGCSVTTSTLSG